MDSNIYFIIGYKVFTYFLVLNLTIDTDFYQLGNKESIKKLLTFRLYPLVACSLSTWLVYLQTNIWFEIFTPSLKNSVLLLVRVLCLAIFVKTAVFTIFLVDGKRHSDFTKKTIKDFIHYFYKRIKSSIQFMIFSTAVGLLVVKYVQTTEPKRFIQNPINSYEPTQMFFAKVMVFLVVYCYLSFEMYMFLARIFLTTDFKNYFPNYKAIKTVLRLYHELQIDAYSKDLDKYIIESDILHFLRNNLSVIYNNFFKINRGNNDKGDNTADIDVHWRVLNLIFSLEMKQVDEIFIRASRGKNAKRFDWMDAILNFYDYIFVNDKYIEAYLALNNRFDHLRMKFEFLKELYIYSFQDNSDKASFDETRQLYKHLKNIYENMLRFMVKFSEVKTNYDKKDILFVFEILILGAEDLLQKMSYCIDRTSFKANLMYN